MRVALFCHFRESSEKSLNYIKFYLEQLKCTHDKVFLLTNDDYEIDSEDLAFYSNNCIDVNLLPNGGYDFGMYYNFLKQYDQIDDISFLTLCNDSCICIKRLEPLIGKILSRKEEVCGIISSFEISNHIQSFFINFKNEGVKYFIDYLMINGICDTLSETVRIYELDMIKSLIDNHTIKCWAMLDGRHFKYNNSNISLCHSLDLLYRGSPLIKRRIVSGSLKDYEIGHMKTRNISTTLDYPHQLDKIIKSFNENICTEFLLDGITNTY
jgi:lipopolysaccharide biosynthesis protein